MKINVKSLNLKEDLKEVYIYQDFNQRRFQIFYNDEKRFPVNLEKMFWKIYGKTKDFFEHLEDIKVIILENVNKKPTGDIRIQFILKEKYDTKNKR